MNICKTTKRTENSALKGIFGSSGDLIDIADMTAKTPFDELMDKEEKEALMGNGSIREGQIEAISRLLSYLLKDKNPLQICIRIFLLAYVIRPGLIDGMTLKCIGDHLGGISKQRLSTKLKQQDELFFYGGRNRKTEDQRNIYSEAQKKSWKERKEKAHPLLPLCSP